MSSKINLNRQRHKGAWLNRIQKEVEKFWPPPLSLNRYRTFHIGIHPWYSFIILYCPLKLKYTCMFSVSNNSLFGHVFTIQCARTYVYVHVHNGRFFSGFLELTRVTRVPVKRAKFWRELDSGRSRYRLSGVHHSEPLDLTAIAAKALGKWTRGSERGFTRELTCTYRRSISSITWEIYNKKRINFSRFALILVQRSWKLESKYLLQNVHFESSNSRLGLRFFWIYVCAWRVKPVTSLEFDSRVPEKKRSCHCL